MQSLPHSLLHHLLHVHIIGQTKHADPDSSVLWCFSCWVWSYLVLTPGDGDHCLKGVTLYRCYVHRPSLPFSPKFRIKKVGGWW